MKEIKMPDTPEEDCWEVSEYIKVEKDLRYTTKIGEYTFNQPISMIDFALDKCHILAIKGVSNIQVGSSE